MAQVSPHVRRTRSGRLHWTPTFGGVGKGSCRIARPGRELFRCAQREPRHRLTWKRFARCAWWQNWAGQDVDVPEGFPRFRCAGCEHELLVAFSCKGRGFCPSCCGRRMAELAAHLVDGVLGGLPVRQWVLTLPYRLRYALAWDHRLCRAVLAVFIRAILSFERRRATRRGVSNGVGGAVTAIQRFGSALNTNVHFHTLVAQGVFMRQADGSVRFAPAPAPSDQEVEALLATVRRRIVRLAARHGIKLDESSDAADAADERLLDNPTYAQMQGAAVVGRLAMGPRAGRPVLRVGRRDSVGGRTSKGPLHAHIDGFDLHAAVAVPAGDRQRLEHLCRYVLRPPLAHVERLERTTDGSGPSLDTHIRRRRKGLLPHREAGAGAVQVCSV